jgi:hypothetical protein
VSIKWMTKVWDEALALQGTPLIVLLCIADHAQDDTGEAWPSIARICHRTRRSERAVFRALDTIEEAGWVERVARPGQSNIYRMIDPATPVASVTPAESAPLSPASPTPVTSVTPPLSPAAPRTIREPSVTQDAAPSPTEPPSEVDAAAAVSHGVTPATVPVVLQRKLQQMGVTDGTVWSQAWASVTSLDWPEFAAAEADRFPEEHLMLHLLAQQEQGRDPSATRWVRFYIEDRNRRIRTIEGQIEQEARMSETPQEREDRLNKRLPPVWEPTATIEERA